MYCTNCGLAGTAQTGFCGNCGHPAARPGAAMPYQVPVPVAQYGAGPPPPMPYPSAYAPPYPGQGSHLVAGPGAADHGPGGVTHWLLPVGRSWQSVVAGYLALFAIVVWPLGPFALGLGGWALVRAAREKAHGTGRAIFAVIVGLLTTFLLFAVLLLR